MLVKAVNVVLEAVRELWHHGGGFHAVEQLGVFSGKSTDPSSRSRPFVSILFVRGMRKRMGQGVRSPVQASVHGHGMNRAQLVVYTHSWLHLARWQVD